MRLIEAGERAMGLFTMRFARAAAVATARAMI